MIRLLVCMFILTITACNQSDETGVYDEILNKPPYASLTDSINKEPERDDLYFRRAVLLNKNDLSAPALADFRKAWSLQKHEPYALGIGTLLQENKPDSAIRFLNEALKIIPGSLMLELSLARAYDQAGKLNEALKVCDHILQTHPQQVDVLKFKADILQRSKDITGATKIMEEAYQLAPYDVELNYELALIYAESKNPKVIRLCDSLMRADNDSSNMHAEPAYYKGIYFSNTGDHQKAVMMFDEAIQRNYYYLNAYIEKGRAQLDQKKTTDALKTFNLALTLSPKFPDAYYWIGRCQEALGQKAEAKLNYQRAYSLDQSFIEAKEAAEKL